MNEQQHDLTMQAIKQQPVSPFSALAPRPKTVEETHLSKQFLTELVSKHLYDAGALTISQLVNRACLSGAIIEEILNYLRQEARLEVLPRLGHGQELFYGLTDLGRVAAHEALNKNGYIGPAPVPVSVYEKVVAAQSVHLVKVKQQQTQEAFKDIVIKDSLLDQLGPALNSGRSIVIYGPPGTGKTYITQCLTRLLTDLCLIPHAISGNESVIQLSDPLVHVSVLPNNDAERSGSLLFQEGYDPRFKLCKRPVVISGGELTLDMLEVQYEPATKIYRAPLQLKANNGMYIIDDMGRQRVAPVALFNRWIVPMEEKRDHLSLGNGHNFEIPFDEILIFSPISTRWSWAMQPFCDASGTKFSSIRWIVRRSARSGSRCAQKNRSISIRTYSIISLTTTTSGNTAPCCRAIRETCWELHRTKRFIWETPPNCQKN